MRWMSSNSWISSFISNREHAIRLFRENILSSFLFLWLATGEHATAYSRENQPTSVDVARSYTAGKKRGSDIEVEKLKDASAQVRYRLEKLDRRQKKILCNLFIDRVEMRRRRENDKWQTTAEIYFRFNPAKFSEASKRDSTVKSQRSANTGALKGKKEMIGGPGGI